MWDELIERIEMAQVMSCTCGTKTPEAEYHAEDCRYRVLEECRRAVNVLAREYKPADAAIVRAWVNEIPISRISAFTAQMMYNTDLRNIAESAYTAGIPVPQIEFVPRELEEDGQ